MKENASFKIDSRKKMTDPLDEEFIDNLILNGAIEFAGIDPVTGEFLYNFTEKLREVDAFLHSKFVEAFRQEVMILWQRGFINMDITSANPVVKLTPKAFDETEVNKLPKELRVNLANIISALQQ